VNDGLNVRKESLIDLGSGGCLSILINSVTANEITR